MLAHSYPCMPTEVSDFLAQSPAAALNLMRAVKATALKGHNLRTSLPLALGGPSLRTSSRVLYGPGKQSRFCKPTIVRVDIGVRPKGARAQSADAAQAARARARPCARARRLPCGAGRRGGWGACGGAC